MSGTAAPGLRSAVLAALVDALGPPRNPDAPMTDRHRNLAWATQAVYEDAFFHLLNTLQRRYRHTRSRLPAVAPIIPLPTARSATAPASRNLFAVGRRRRRRRDWRGLCGLASRRCPHARK